MIKDILRSKYPTILIICPNHRIGTEVMKELVVHAHGKRSYRSMYIVGKEVFVAVGFGVEVWRGFDSQKTEILYYPEYWAFVPDNEMGNAIEWNHQMSQYFAKPWNKESKYE